MQPCSLRLDAMKRAMMWKKCLQVVRRELSESSDPERGTIDLALRTSRSRG
jgi:hypothetical protein